VARTKNFLTIAEARRIALVAQGFAAVRPGTPKPRDLLKTIDRLSLHQIDSVNVITRAHYLPSFSRLGAYDRNTLDQMAWGSKGKRRLFEYWGHEASLLPMDLFPLFRWRMAKANRGEIGWKSVRAFATERRGEAEAVLARIQSEGALAASDCEGSKGQSGWWEWSQTKLALEWLFWAGHVTTAYRRASFERVYDLTERVIPAAILNEAEPSEGEADRSLIARAARALGVATAGDLRDYFRLRPEPFSAALVELVEEGVLRPVSVEETKRLAYVHADAHLSRKVEARALLAPFDPLVWERSRTERWFGFRYRIEIYTPAPRRVHGYYVLPFLFGDRLVARVDVKADRQRSRLVVRQVTLEENAPVDTREALDAELLVMAGWLGLEHVHVEASTPHEPSSTFSEPQAGLSAHHREN
jgi:uncharacterized protein YcaQ